MQQRLKKHPYLALFDGADPNSGTAARSLTTTPVQALFMINSPFTREQAEKDMETSAHEVLANPVIEEYRVQFLD